MALTFPVAPMKAAIGALPHDDDGWAFEIKWDGYRTLCHVAEGQVRVQSSSGLDVSATYPELAALAGAVNARQAILDGELVVLDADGKPRFELLQRHSTEAAFYAFDVLAIDGADTVGLPYEQRRALLDALVEPGPNWLVPAYQVGDGGALLDVVAAQGLEGVMAKRLGATYAVGKRSPSWRKVKVRRPVRMVVGGFTTGTGARAATFGSLLVGTREGDRLRFAGGVGTGFDQRMLDALARRLRGLRSAACPFDPPPPAAVARSATWVTPAMEIEAEIAEFTNDGLVRHASFVRVAP